MNNSKWWKQYQEHLDQGMTSEEIAEACQDAADLLEGNWIKGAWYSEETGRRTYCLEGGLAAALGMNAADLQEDGSTRITLYSCPVYQAVEETIDLAEPDKWESIPNWNDNSDRDEAEVLNLLRTTAKRVLGVGPDQMEVTS